MDEAYNKVGDIIDTWPSDEATRREHLTKLAHAYDTFLKAEIDRIVALLKDELTKFPQPTEETLFYKGSVNAMYLLQQRCENAKAELLSNKTEDVFHG